MLSPTVIIISSSCNVKQISLIALIDDLGKKLFEVKYSGYVKLKTKPVSGVFQGTARFLK